MIEAAAVVGVSLTTAAVKNYARQIKEVERH